MPLEHGISAHGLGGGSDLPIPAEFAIAGGTAALTVSFAVLLIAWRHPRFTSARGRPVPGWLVSIVESTAFAVVLRALGLVLLGYFGWAALAGQDLVINPVLGVFYVWIWVGIVPFSLLFGPAFKAISPARTLHLLLAKAMRVDPRQGVLEFPARLGYWPAAIGLFAFVWMELVYAYSTELASVRFWFAAYLAIMLVGGALFGSRWLERADPFEVYSTLVGHLSVWGRDEDGRLVWMNPMRNLTRIRPEAGLVAVVAVLLGSTAYDSFRDSNWWLRKTQFLERGEVTALSTLALLATVLIVGVTFALATMATGTDDRTPRRSLPAVFAHSLVPIIIGYMVAHYLTYFVEVGQQTLIQASDPLSNGSNLLGTGDWQVNYWLSYHPTLLATIKVLAIVVGHVLGCVAAHDKAIAVLPRRHHVTGQLPLLAAMVLYTFSGLYLLFGV
ncbi:hypothetical protein [Nocardioides pantholopis]|uniref:hypothetical protein n=1 Tax=Nocardioides pantholopis TaxID=2483798 RepID=UPI000F091AF7|nr:hypothetical protein [Nocardioides pantholopis]